MVFFNDSYEHRHYFTILMLPNIMDAYMPLSPVAKGG